jgi:Uma2 family endonuclease
VLFRSTGYRDRGEKKIVYAIAGVREYWLVDPRARTVTVHGNNAAAFDRGVVLVEGDTLTSTVLVGFACPVRDLF